MLLVEDDLTKIKVSKVDIADGEELPGATIQIIDSKGEVIEEWTSGKKPHEITGLKTGEEYTLRETVAPDGYAVATDTTFTIDEHGNVTSSGSVTEDGILLVEDAKTVVKISKVDVDGGKEIAGAQLQVISVDAEGNENIVENWTSEEGKTHTIEGLKTGVEYILRETVAPDGYTVATDTTFTIDEAGKVTTTGKKTIDKDGHTVLLVEDAKTEVSVSKTDIASGKELKGAKIQVLDDDDNVVEINGKKVEWISSDKPHVIKGLETDVTYTLREVVAPDGYTIATDIEFSISKDGKVTVGETVVEDGHILIEDAKTKVSVSKVDIADGEEIEGATIKVIDSKGETVEEWVSGDKPHTIEGLKTGEEYTLRETVAPEGYTIATDTKFTIDEKGNVKSDGSVTEDGILLVEDAKTSVKVSKVDIADGKELPGATIQVLDEDGKVVEIDGQKVEWVSTDEAHEIVGLKTGEEYTLRETVAPDGYTIATDTTFTIDETGKVTTTGTMTEDGVILIEDAKTKISVSKVDIADGKEVEGATIKVIDSKGETVEEWVSGDKPHTIEGLKAGEEYTLRETVAPEGYTVATDTKFSVDENGKVTSSGSVTEDGILLVEDAKTSVTVSKVDIADGEELPGATIQIIDSKGETVEEWVSTDEPHTIEGLKAGENYILRETVAPEGYAIATDTEFTIDKDGTVTVTKGSTTEDGTILVNDALTKVSVSKVDIADGEEVEGAKLQVLDEDGNVARDINNKRAEWTSGKEPHIIEGLRTGVEYTLHEAVAPEGYTVATDTTFTIEADGTVTVIFASSKDEGGETVLLVEDAKTVIKVSKTDIADGAEVEGATIQLIDSEGNVVEEWVSTTEAHEIVGLRTNEKYTLRETVAPDGYTVATDTTFTIDETGKVTTTGTITEDGVILIEDNRTTFTVSKTVVGGGMEVPGAKLQILDENGVVAELLSGEKAEWISTDEPYEVEGLKAGDYILRETVAPNGYTIATDIAFTLDIEGNISIKGEQVENNHILVEDDLTQVKVSKTDIADGFELPGAKMQVILRDGTGMETVVKRWVSGEEPETIQGLLTNTEYILREVVAPDGYAVTTDIAFTIDQNGKVTTSAKQTVDENGVPVILVEDAKTEVSVSKTDIASGEEIKGARIQVLDDAGNVVEVNGKKVEWVSNGKPHKIVGLKTGVDYVLRETVAPDGYTIATDIDFSITRDGKVMVGDTVVEGGHILIEDAKTKVSVSKTDIADGEEIEGATIQILNSDGDVVEEWTSTTEPHAIEGLLVGEEYTLRETVAPDGYTVATDTTFTIDENGKVKTTGSKTIDEDGNTVLLVEDAKTVVRVTKSDIADGEELPGATIQIIDSEGNVVEEWVSATDDEATGDVNEAIHVIEGLKTGEEYTLRETVAPDGYTVATDTKFSIDEQGNVKTKGSKTTDEDGNTVLLVEDAKTVVKVSKTDIADGEELEGAKIQILDKDGNVVEQWTSTTEAHEVEGLKTGEEYTLRETVAPDGYTIATDTKFTIDETGKVTSSGSVTEDGILLVEDAITKVTISKADIADGKELEGAQMSIQDAEGNVVKTVKGEEAKWISTAEPKVIEGLKTGVEYTLVEEVAPDGYKVTTSTTFVIDEHGKVTTTGTKTVDENGNETMVVEDAKTVVKVSKVDIADGEELEGATIQVLDKDDNVIDEWVSTDEVHTIEGLKTGEQYTLRETVAPEGHTIATDTTFSIDEHGNVTSSGSVTEDGVILIEDAKTVVKVSKTDIADGEEIPGATIQIIDSEGNVVEGWTSTTEPHVIEGLKTGVTYTLKESVAPDGYTIATETTFSIDENGKVTSSGTVTEDGIMLVEDAKTKVTISKTDLGTGEEVSGATIQVLDKDGNVVEEWTSEAGKAHVIEGLKTETEYTLRETVAPDGYAVTTDTTFTIATDGTVKVGETTPNDGTILVEDAKTVVKVSKTDVADGKELEGATIQVIDSEGKVVEEWVSTKEAHVIEGLKTGVEYTLRETVAPDGYAIATDTTFSITADGTVVTKGTMTDGGIILIEDAQLTGTGTISLKKELVENIPWQTDEEFEFTLATEDGTKVEIIKVKADEEKSFKTLSFDKPGTYYYTITETKGDTLHVTYDTETKWAKVEAKANEAKTALDITVTYGTSKEACTEDTLVITNVYAAPALEKYINKDVHQDLPAFDTPFTYDILAFVTNDAERVVIKDPLVQGIRFLDGANTKVTVQDIGTENDHTAHGTVEKAQGTPVGEFTAKVDTTNKLLTVDIPKAEEQGLRGHWVRVTYQVILDNEIVGVEEEYEKNDEDVGDNHTVISKDYPEHDGVKTGANYIVYAENGDYPLEANDITVTPPTKTTKVTKAWVDAQGKEIAWPKDAKVTIELLGNGKSLKEATAEVLGKGKEIDNMTVTLDANNPTKTFTDVPIYESITYTVKEIKVEGVPEGFANTCVSTGNMDEGFKVTNTLKKDDTKKDDTKKDDTKKDDGDTGNSNKGGSTNTTGGTTGSSRTGGGSTTSERLASTGDPTAETSLLTMLLTGIGSALVGGGVFLRRRKRDEER